MHHRLRARRLLGCGDGLRHPRSENPRCVVIGAKALFHVQVGADKGRVVGIPQRVVGGARLLNAEMLHGIGKGLLVFVTAGLHVVDQLQVHPVVYPVPVQIVDDDVLLKYPSVVAAPGEKGHILAAELLELLPGLGKAHPVGKPVPVEAGELLHLVMDLPEIRRPHINGEFLSQRQVGIQLDRTDFNNLSPQMNRELIKNRGVRPHCLVPFKIHHNIAHTNNMFLYFSCPAIIT